MLGGPGGIGPRGAGGTAVEGPATGTFLAIVPGPGGPGGAAGGDEPGALLQS